MTNNSTPNVTFDINLRAVQITNLTLIDPAVTTEALRWSTGVRGPALAPAEMAGADLSVFAERAFDLGARALAQAGNGQDVIHIQSLVDSVEKRTAQTVKEAADATAGVVNQAATSMREAAATAKKELISEEQRARKAFHESVASAQAALTTEVRNLLGGEDPELVARLALVVERFKTELAERSERHSTDLYEKATKVLDPDDPASPLAKHRAISEKQHQVLTQQMEKQTSKLESGLRELRAAVLAQHEITDAKNKLANVTPLKGGSYEDSVNAILAEIAVGLGDSYEATGRIAGALSARNLKGDGVLTIQGGPARLVIEMCTSERKAWNDYLDEAERNRSAQASLGVVPTADLNAGHGLRVLGPRRLVMAFEAAQDDPDILRTAVLFLRLSALAAANAGKGGRLDTAREAIGKALDALGKIEAIRKASGTIRTNADTIDKSALALHSSLSRLLDEARIALDDNAVEAIDDAPANGPTQVA